MKKQKQIIWNEYNYNKVKKRLAKGENYKQIASDLGIATNSLRNTIRRYEKKNLAEQAWDYSRNCEKLRRTLKLDDLEEVDDMAKIRGRGYE